MPMFRSTFRVAALGVSLLSGFASAAWADEEWPNKQPIRLIVPYAAGGNTDVVGRLVAAYMTKSLKAQVVVDNRAGAGGITGTQALAAAPADGYWLCVCALGPITITPAVDKLPYDPLKDLAPVSMINTNPLVAIVNPKTDVKTIPELIAWGKAKPGGLNYGTSGIGGLMYFSSEIFRNKTGIEMTHVPFRGGSLATAALVAGEIDVVFANMSDAMGQLNAKTVRPIGISTATRSPLLPDVAPIQDQGVADYNLLSWNAMFAPPGVPRPIIDRLVAVMADMANDPEIKGKMADFGSDAVANTPEAFGKDLKEETARWAAYLKGMQTAR